MLFRIPGGIEIMLYVEKYNRICEEIVDNGTYFDAIRDSNASKDSDLKIRVMLIDDNYDLSNCIGYIPDDSLSHIRQESIIYTKTGKPNPNEEHEEEEKHHSNSDFERILDKSQSSEEESVPSIIM
jgi:hypothetical protein